MISVRAVFTPSGVWTCEIFENSGMYTGVVPDLESKFIFAGGRVVGFVCFRIADLMAVGGSMLRARQIRNYFFPR